MNLFQPRQSENKMVIVIRSDQGIADLPIGFTSKLVNEAVIKAYQSGVDFNPKVIQEWEDDAWPKIVLKCKNEAELLKVE